jgi:hypothetical protein
MTRLEQITTLVRDSGNDDLIRWWKQFTACATKMRKAQRAFSKSRTTADKDIAVKFERWFDDALLDQRGLFDS